MTTDALPETTHFGFTRIGAGEASSKNGWSFSDLDRLKIDDLLYAALTHTHDGAAALGDPTDPPDLSTAPTGGALPAATSYYYRVAYVDQYGLESAASPEATITTPDPLPSPTAPGAAVENADGTILPGIYSYLISVVDAYGGETTPSSPSNVQVVGGTTNRVRLNLPDLTGTASYFNVYRARPGQSAFYLIGNTSAVTFYDTGIVEDQTVQAPTVNTSNAANSVTIGIPLGFVPDGCVAWKIYRATSSGGYDGNSLVHQVIEGETETSATPMTSWDDIGDNLEQGFPQNRSSTVPSGSLLRLDDINGTLPATVIPRGVQCISAFAPGLVTDARIVTVTESPYGIRPVRFTAYFATPPDTGSVIRVRMVDVNGFYVDLTCPDTPQPGDPVGYYHRELPLLTSASFDAASGSRSSGAVVVTDPASLSTQSQAVQLSAAGDNCSVSLGTLDSGDYTVRINLRPLLVGTATNDMVFDVIRTDTSDVIETRTSTFDAVEDGYVEFSFPFSAPGSVELEIRAQKATAATQSYNVDLFGFIAGTPALASGRLTIQTFVDSGPTAAADVNVACWF